MEPLIPRLSLSNRATLVMTIQAILEGCRYVKTGPLNWLTAASRGSELFLHGRSAAAIISAVGHSKHKRRNLTSMTFAQNGKPSLVIQDVSLFSTYISFLP